MKEHILFPNETITTTTYFEVSQDWEVPIPGFFIISPLRAVRSIADFSDSEALEFITLIRKIRIGMRDILKIEDVYFFQNEDTTHNFHLWIFPRHKWMEQFGRKIQSVRPIMNYAKEHMVNDEIFQEVKKNAKEMKEYMSS